MHREEKEDEGEDKAVMALFFAAVSIVHLLNYLKHYKLKMYFINILVCNTCQKKGHKANDCFLKHMFHNLSIYI